MGLFRHDGVVNMPLSARRRRPYASSALKRRIYASFGTTASSICPFRHDRVVYMPLSARLRRQHASFGTTASSMGLFRHDGVVYMPPFGTSASSVCLFRHDCVVNIPLSTRQRRLWASFGTTGIQFLTDLFLGSQAVRHTRTFRHTCQHNVIATCHNNLSTRALHTLQYKCA